MTTPIEELRTAIRRDYETMAREYDFPSTLSFEAAIRVVHVGVNSRKDYPFKKFQNDVCDVLIHKQLPNNILTTNLQILGAVWNYFPHKDLGMSPIEAIREEKSKTITTNENGDATIDLDAYFNAVDEKLEYLAEVSEKTLARHLEKIGCTAKDARTLVAFLSDPTCKPDDALIKLFDCVRARKTKRPKIVTMEDIQPAVRALAACENHTISIMPNNHRNSRMFQTIVEQTMNLNTSRLTTNTPDDNLHEMIEPLSVLDALIKTHQNIQKTHTTIRADITLHESAHHILDWLALTDVREIIARPPRETALIMLGVARLISCTGDPAYQPGCTDAQIRRKTTFLKSEPAYEKEIRRIAQIALESCNDPGLMLADLPHIPDDADSRLAALAPRLALRSPIDADQIGNF